jgi:hypothetical protein
VSFHAVILFALHGILAWGRAQEKKKVKKEEEGGGG